MGTLKQLLPLGDKPVIRHCVDTIVAAGIRPVIVVINIHDNGIPDALHGTLATIVRNTVPDSQMSDSVRSGLGAINDRCSGVLICLSDHPLISIGTYTTIISAHVKAPDTIVIPVYGGRRGHPSLIPPGAVREIVSGANLRDVIRKDASRLTLLDVADEGVVLDMDTDDDYRRIVANYTARQSGYAAGIKG
jgi:molybdenum cofactor cytidylyltransferase